MPRYTVRDPLSGKTVVLTGDSPPTEAELENIFGVVNGQVNADDVPPYRYDRSADKQNVVVEIPGVGNVQFPTSMTTTQIAQASAKLYQEAQGKSGAPSKASSDPVEQLASFLPMIGGTVGGIAGGIPGAALGGAAGRGYESILDNASEILPALQDIASNITTYPRETLSGFVSGATGGALDSAKSGAVQGAAEAVGAGVMGGLAKGGRAVYRSYLRPPLRANVIAKARDIVETGIREKLPITAGGERRARKLIAELNQQVNTLLARNKGTVDLHQVAERVRAFAKAKYNRAGVDPADLKAALAVADSLDRHPSLGIPDGVNPTRVDVSLTEANRIKRDVRPASRTFGQPGVRAETATRKAAGRQLRKAIEAVEPQVGPLNARESQVLDALDAITRATARHENSHGGLFGVPTALATTVGIEEGYRHDSSAAGLVAALTARGLMSPAVASRAAILATRFAKVPGTLPATAARLAIHEAFAGSDAQ